tara:strand:+ start:88 stop:528 length:441 start_codon:yes stop_codon:yes gene_type:complete
LIIYLGSFYILLGSIFLFIPLIYLEVGRPKDLLRAFLNLLIGIILIIKNKFFDNSVIAIFLFLTALIVLYLLEIFSSRWNQLTDQEKSKLTTLVEFKKNLSTISEAITLAVKNFKNSLNFFKFARNNENLHKKKWVRNDKNDNIKS